MSVNIESFDNFDSDQQIAAHQSGLVRVVLEGQNDVNLFSRFWFVSMLETFDFVEAGHVVGGSGCTAVQTAVQYSLQIDHVPAFGIIDGDNLFRVKEWSSLFAVNERHPATAPLDVYVASLWEIEAYMLEPDLFAMWVYGSHRSAPGSKAECDSALTRALLECDFLLEMAPFFAAAHAEGEQINQACYLNIRAEAPEAARQDSAQKLAGFSPASQFVAQTVDTLVAAVRSNSPNGEADRLRFLLRYVDTKRLLIRLFEILKVSRNSHWVMPTLQMQSNRRPVEFENYLDLIKSHCEE